MKKRTLSDLTSEEIGQLFPVEISPYDPEWPQLFEKERQLIKDHIDQTLFSRIAHFGSTSVPGLSAKNTIDILMEVSFNEALNDSLITQMKAIGYDFNWQTEGLHTHMVFIKGYDPEEPALQTYHIHAAPQGHILWNRIHFRDYLIAHPETAQAYAELKEGLASRYKHERVAYRIAKTEFVQQITEKSLAKI